MLGDQTSLTNLNALMHELTFLHLDLQKLSQSYDQVVLHFSLDGSPTVLLLSFVFVEHTTKQVELVVDYVGTLVGPLGNVILCSNTSCMLHALNRIVADHVGKKDSRFDMTGLCSLTKLAHLGLYFDKFAAMVKTLAVRDPIWEQHGPAEGGHHARQAVALCLPNLDKQSSKKKVVEQCLCTLNMPWDIDRVGHACVIRNGRPCCATLAQAKSKIRVAVSRLLLQLKPKIPAATRWMTVNESLGWWMLGCYLNRLFIRAWALAFPESPRALSGAQDDSDTDAPNLSFAAQTGRRMARGRRRMASHEFHLNNALTQIMLRPLQYTMGRLFDSSREAFFDDTSRVSAVIASVNMCSNRLIKILQANTEDRCGPWGILRCLSFGAVVLDETTRSYMRRELLRIIGGVHMRMVRPLLEHDTQLWDMMENSHNDEVILRRASLCRERACCAAASTHAFHSFIRAEARERNLGMLRRVKKSWVPSILNTERDHKSNGMRVRSQGSKVRRWRRQVSSYIIGRARQRWLKCPGTHPEIARRCASRSASDVPRGAFENEMFVNERSGVGGNTLFFYINQRRREIYQANNAIDRSQAAEVALKRRLATEFRALSPLRKRELLSQFRQQQRLRRRALQAEVESIANQVVERHLPESHWGMGTTRSPLDLTHIQSAVGAFGGLTQAADRTFPEIELVIPPAGRRLGLPPLLRDYCKHKHFGFCKTRDADIADQVACVHHHLVKHSPVEGAGARVFRFYPLQGADNRNRAFDLHVSFASLRQAPKFCAMFMKGEATDRHREVAISNFEFVLHNYFLFMCNNGCCQMLRFYI